MANTAERLAEIMKEKRLRQVDILELSKPYCKKYNIKLTKSDLSQFVSGKVTPGQWKLTILGLALDVNEVWLMGYDVPRERTEGPPPGLDSIPGFSSLTQENKETIANLVSQLLKAQSSDQ